MAGSATPYGFRAVNLLGGRPFNNAFSMQPIANGYTTNIFFGDVVKINSSGNAVKDTATTSLTPLGIFVGCQYTDPSLKYFVTRQYWPASTVATDAQAYIVDDPDAVFQIQASGVVTQTAVGENFVLVQTTGSTTTGMSAVTIDAANHSTTSTYPVRLIGFVNGPTSTVGDAYTDCIVIWNAGLHQYRNATGV